jgi:hypothetical protein
MDEVINGHKISVACDGPGLCYAETKLIPHADRQCWGPFARREAAEEWIREHVPNWPAGYF